MWRSMDSNAGVMFRHQSEPRGGGQPEGSVDDPRGEAESMSRNHLVPVLGDLNRALVQQNPTSLSMWGFALQYAQNENEVRIRRDDQDV